MIDREPIVLFIQKSDKSDQYVPSELPLKKNETQKDVTDGKKRNHFDGSLCE